MSTLQTKRAKQLKEEWKLLYQRLWWITVLVSPYAVFCLFIVPFWITSIELKVVFLSVWMIGIPAYFAFEWRYLLPEKASESHDYKVHKEAREVLKDFWLSIAAVLALIYVGGHLNYGESTKPGGKEEADVAKGKDG